MCGNGARLPGIEGGFMTTLTPEQARALDHAREVLAEEKYGSGKLAAEWYAEMRMALRDLVQALDAP